MLTAYKYNNCTKHCDLLWLPGTTAILHSIYIPENCRSRSCIMHLCCNDIFIHILLPTMFLSMYSVQLYINSDHIRSLYIINI